MDTQSFGVHWSTHDVGVKQGIRRHSESVVLPVATEYCDHGDMLIYCYRELHANVFTSHNYIDICSGKEAGRTTYYIGLIVLWTNWQWNCLCWQYAVSLSPTDRSPMVVVWLMHGTSGVLGQSWRHSSLLRPWNPATNTHHQVRM